MRTAIVAVAAVLLFAGCGTKERDIAGQVFIVTGGGYNVKLALVNVNFFSENVILDHLKKRHESGVAQQTALLPALADAHSDREGALARLRKANATVATLMESPQTSGRIDYRALKAELDAAIVAAKQSQEKAKEIQAKFDYFTGGAFLIDGMPVPLAAAKTDADGKFGIKLRAGKYVVVATAGRSLGTSEEKYYWLVKTDTSTQDQSLMLSNDNLVGMDCAECIRFEKAATK